MNLNLWWYTFGNAIWAAILVVTFLRSANAGWRAEHLQILDVSGSDWRSCGDLSGAIPNAVGSLAKLTKLDLSWQILSGAIPHAVGSMTALQMLSLLSVGKPLKKLSGAIPNAVGSLSKLTAVFLSGQTLSGPIPHVVGSMTVLELFFLARNSLRGPIPEAVGSFLLILKMFIGYNSLSGPIPQAVCSMQQVNKFDVSFNSLRGPLPQAVGSTQLVQDFELQSNSLRGPIPHVVGSMQQMKVFSVHHNSLRGPIPQVVSSFPETLVIHVSYNSLCGPIPLAVGSLQQVQHFEASFNSLRGPIPQAVGFMQNVDTFGVSSNSLSGTIPVGIVAWNELQLLFFPHDNQLSGSIPRGLFMKSGVGSDIRMFAHGNRLTGTLPDLKYVTVLTASGNLLEGGLPNTFSSELRVLDASGIPGRIGGLVGPLPPALRQASELQILTLANQQMYGGVPSFSSTLLLLALHNNLLKILSDFHIADNASTTTILLHENLLSCYVPMCDNASAKTSIIAIGNRLRYPKGDKGRKIRKLDLRTGTGWRFFSSILFGSPSPFDFPGK